MTRFHEQMKILRSMDYGNVYPNDDWELQDYKDIFWCIDQGYLVQDCGESFMINEEWEGDDIYAEEFLPEEEVVECGGSEGCDGDGVVKWAANECYVCRDCAKNIMKNVKSFNDRWSL